MNTRVWQGPLSSHLGGDTPSPAALGPLPWPEDEGQSLGSLWGGTRDLGPQVRTTHLPPHPHPSSLQLGGLRCHQERWAGLHPQGGMGKRHLMQQVSCSIFYNICPSFIYLFYPQF